MDCSIKENRKHFRSLKYFLTPMEIFVFVLHVPYNENIREYFAFQIVLQRYA